MRRNRFALVAAIAAIAGVLGSCSEPAGPDTSPPTIVLNSWPCCTITLPGTMLILSANVSDNVGVTFVEFFDKAPGQLTAQRVGADSMPPFSINYPSVGFGESDNGAHEISAAAHDAAGNVGTSATLGLGVGIDVTAPVITLGARGDRITYASSLVLSVGSSEPLARIELFDNGVKIAEAFDPILPKVFAVPFSRSDNATHVLTASGVDARGNVGWSPPSTVTVDISWQWVTEVGAGSYGQIQGVSPDGAGGVYVAAWASAGGNHAVLGRIGADGGLLWTRSLGDATQPRFGMSVAAGIPGDVYLSGPSRSTNDVFLARYDATGALAWTREIDVGLYDDGGYVATDGQGNAYVAGDAQDSLSSLFLAKFDRDGNQTWLRRISSSSALVRTRAIAVDPGPGAGIYVTGFVAGDLAGNSTAGDYDAFLAKFDDTGNLVWLRFVGTAGGEQANGVAVDPTGAVYLAGEASTAGTDYDAWLAKIDAGGTVLWTRRVGTSELDFGYAVTADANGATLVGITYGTFPGFVQNISNDLFLSRIGSDGVALDIRTYGFYNQTGGLAVFTDGVGGAFVGGFEAGTAIVLKHTP